MIERENQLRNQVREAFAGVTLGDGIGLWQGQGLDDYEDEETLAELRARDEKSDWSAIPVAELDRCCSSLSFFDAEGMRFHLPAYLTADLEGTLFTDHFMFDLTNFSELGGSRFSLLNAAQRAAVRDFLVFRHSDPVYSAHHQDIEKSLREAWQDS